MGKRHTPATSYTHLHTSSTTPLCCHRPLCPSCQPYNFLSLVPTAELLYPRSPVVERSPDPHKNCSVPAYLPLQLEDSPLPSVPRLREFPNLLSIFPYLSLAPVSSYLALLNYICLGMVLYGSLTWPIQLVYLIYIHDLSTKSMWNVPYLACSVVVWPWIALLCMSFWIKASVK